MLFMTLDLRLHVGVTLICTENQTITLKSNITITFK